MTIPQAAQAALDNVAEQRHQRYMNHPQNAPLVDNYMVMAMAGEFAFGRFCGQMPDLEQRTKGDGGVDFSVPIVMTVDVKTISMGHQNLLHKVDKPMADLFVLAEYDAAKGEAVLIGWTSATELRQNKPQKFGHDYENYHLHRSALRPMGELGGRLGSIQKGAKP
jgi:hypothetical protein